MSLDDIEDHGRRQDHAEGEERHESQGLEILHAEELKVKYEFENDENGSINEARKRHRRGK